MRRHPKKKGNPNHHIHPLSADKVERLLYGETLPNIQIKERLKQTKGTFIMPSLQDALQIAMQKQQQDNASLHATINEWAQDEQPKPETKPEEKAMPNPQPTYNVAHLTPSKVRFVPTVGVSEAVFNYVLDNPGKSRTEIIKTLVAQGFKESSVSSLIGQYLRMDYVFRDSDGKYRTAFKDYKPLPSTKRQIAYWNAKQAAANGKRTPAPKTITLVTKKPKAQTAGIAALKVDTAPQIAPISQFDIENMPIKQARALYDELKKLFGG